MMNKHLYIAQIARGATAKEVATAIGIPETEYTELLSGIKKMTCELAEKLSEFFDLSAILFMECELGDMRVLTDALEKQRSLLTGLEKTADDDSMHLRIARVGIEATIALQKNAILSRDLRDIELENHVLKALYEDLKSRTATKGWKSE